MVSLGWDRYIAEAVRTSEGSQLDKFDLKVTRGTETLHFIAKARMERGLAGRVEVILLTENDDPIVGYRFCVAEDEKYILSALGEEISLKKEDS